MKWYFGNGSKILIGSRMMLGLEEHQHILAQLFHILNQRGIFFLHQVIKDWVGEAPRWKNFDDFRLDQIWEGIWLKYTNRLSSMGLCRRAEGDRMLWEGKKADEGLKARDIYAILIKKMLLQEPVCWF